MPSKHNLNVSLTEHLCDFIGGQVALGRFRTVSEVVRAALRLLEQDGRAAEQSAEMPERTP
jgi:antitoxin ParD1/3/4